MKNIFTSKKNKKKAITALLSFLVFLIIIIILSRSYFGIFENPEKIRLFLNSYGVLAPLIFIGLQIFQVIFAPIPGQFMGIASGYMFGIWLGTLYTMIGTTVGSAIIFYLSRKFGRPFVEKVISRDALKKFDYISQEKGVFALFLLFLLPAIPDDALCFIAGLSNIRIRTLIIISFIGRLPGFFILNLVGNGIAVSRVWLSAVIFSIMMVISIIIYYNRKRIEHLLAI